MKVFIDPSSQIYYASFYIKGLYDVFGKKNVSFSSHYFKNLRRNEGRNAYDVYFAFVVINNDKISKFVIDFADDASDINRSAYKWADYYAKVNINKSFRLYYAYDKTVDYDKIIQLPPYFGIKIWNLSETIYHCLVNYIKSYNNKCVGLYSYIKDYVMQYIHRSDLKFYENSANDVIDNYVFFASNLWNIDGCNNTTNIIREKFVKACIDNNKINFEGGFIIPQNHPLTEEFKKYSINKRYPIHTYLNKIKRSVLAFNTPAVHYCHGWKLGEFFCLGKVIISTSFSNQIPEGIIDKKNILFVDSENIGEVINKIFDNDEYKHYLRKNAKEYWKNYACPQSVIKKLTNNIK